MNSSSTFFPSEVQTRKMPVNSFLRMWTLGNSQAKIAANFFAYALRKNFAGDVKKQDLKNHYHLKSAVQLMGTMGYLRGAIMKVGQLFANLPHVVPQQLIEVFESLQFEAPPMHFSLIREVFLDEFDKEPEEIFASFDRKAFAAASLGQVHRARLPGGRDVAVKIQYPNIAETIDADIKALSLLLQTMRFKKDFRFLQMHVQDARKVFLKEVDYLSEAAFMEKNRKLFEGSKIVVPRHYPEFSTKRILTIDYLPGQHLQNFLSGNPSQSKRNHYGELISYSLVHSWFRFKTAYADLHPGNYVLMKDGRLGFLDFGCYRKFDEQRWKLEVESERAMFEGDRDKLMHFMTILAMHDHPSQLDPDWVDLFSRQIQWVVAPVIADGPFDFGDDRFAEEGAALIKEAFRKGYTRTDAFYNWTNRSILGHRSLMYKLRCKIDYSLMYLAEMRRYF